jgi:hypothetical protein
MFIPAMLPPLALAGALELAAVVVDVLSALAQPAISTTPAHASAPRAIVLRTLSIWYLLWWVGCVGGNARPA